MTDNPFLAYAAKANPWAARKKLRAEQKEMHKAQKKAVIKALAERDLLMKLWKQWRKDLIKEELEGPYQQQIQTLITFLNKMTLKDKPQLLKLVKAGPWINAPPDVKFLVLRLIDARLAFLNEKAGLPPFDDAMLYQPPTVFQIIRASFMEKSQ
jgi:hypothetical protein